VTLQNELRDTEKSSNTEIKTVNMVNSILIGDWFSIGEIVQLTAEGLPDVEPGLYMLTGIETEEDGSISRIYFEDVLKDILNKIVSSHPLQTEKIFGMFEVTFSRLREEGVITCSLMLKPFKPYVYKAGYQDFVDYPDRLNYLTPYSKLDVEKVANLYKEWCAKKGSTLKIAAMEYDPERLRMHVIKNIPGQKEAKEKNAGSNTENENRHKVEEDS
jgi:hypothetical protein